MQGCQQLIWVVSAALRTENQRHRQITRILKQHRMPDGTIEEKRIQVDYITR